MKLYLNRGPSLTGTTLKGNRISSHNRELAARVVIKPSKFGSLIDRHELIEYALR
jgi:hypothetical protein